MEALIQEHLFNMLNPDDDTGYGYGTTKTKHDKLGKAHSDFPYGWEPKEEETFDWDPDEFGFDNESDIDRFSNKIGNSHLASDPGAVKDPFHFVDGSTRGVSESELKKIMVLVLEDIYRLRSASSTPDSLGGDAWPGATPPKYPVRQKRREPAYTLKSIMVRDEDQWDSYEGDVDEDDLDNPVQYFDFQEANYNKMIELTEKQISNIIRKRIESGDKPKKIKANYSRRKT